MHFDLVQFLYQLGPFATAAITAIIFAESGLFFGFFLPGDSLLFTAGVLSSQKFLNIWLVWILCFVAAFAGDSVGYWMGKKYGRRLFQKKDSLLFKQEHLRKAETFYEEHGKKTIILARFVPIVRTFAPIVAGIGDMEYKTFISYNIIGGFLWTTSMVWGGHFLGNLIPADKVDKYLLPIILVIIVASLLPAIKHLLPAKAKT